MRGAASREAWRFGWTSERDEADARNKILAARRESATHDSISLFETQETVDGFHLTPAGVSPLCPKDPK